MILRSFLCALGLAASATAVAAEPPERELIYGAELMAPEERAAYRREIERAGTKEREAQVRERHRERLRKRARDRGVELKEPQGVVDLRK
jgi:hypothetical protein